MISHGASAPCSSFVPLPSVPLGAAARLAAQVKRHGRLQPHCAAPTRSGSPSCGQGAYSCEPFLRAFAGLAIAAAARRASDTNRQPAKGVAWRLRLPKAPSMAEVKKYGTGMVFSYSFVGTLNMCIMVALSWPVFILRTGASPLLFAPFKLNPKFVVYLTAVYFSYGSCTTPFLLAAAMVLAPVFTGALSTLQDRMRCPKWLAFLILASLMAGSYCILLVLLITLSCAAFRTPIWVAG
eukprot:TRINITY_DN45452_c0_g1_i1.p1 TRINITY_DN45452_c0_g1~~TRINITY_DN45452_c0_g1_i1.p1  ORF type:complete len:238 (-),score=33.17 TRINITY_DN45452_c0_g1_i1:69-782(-)